MSEQDQETVGVQSPHSSTEQYLVTSAARLVIELAVFVDVANLVSRARVLGAYRAKAGIYSVISAEQIDESLRTALDRELAAQSQELKNGRTGSRPGSQRDEFLVSGLGVHPDRAHQAAVEFNSLALSARKAFYEVGISGTPFNDLVGTIWETEDALRNDILSALEALTGKHRGAS